MQGALRSEAPLLLEVFTALFDLAEPQAVLAAPSLQAARRAHAPASNRGNTAEAAMARPQPPRSRAQRGQAAASNGATKVQGRHPRFGGVFTTKADFSGSRARISIGRANFQDTLGPVASVAASAGKVRCHIQPDARFQGFLSSHAHLYKPPMRNRMCKCGF